MPIEAHDLMLDYDIQHPDEVEVTWNIRAADNRLQLALIKRWAAGFHVVLRRREEISEDMMRWVAIGGTGTSHHGPFGESEAHARVRDLLKGGWRRTLSVAAAGRVPPELKRYIDEQDTP